MPPTPKLSGRVRDASYEVQGRLNIILTRDGEDAAIQHAHGIIAGAANWLAMKDRLFAATALSAAQARISDKHEETRK